MMNGTEHQTMKNKRYIIWALVGLLTLGGLAGCKKRVVHINVSEGQVVGVWVKNNTREYWRFDSDNTGVTWDESEDISESESNLRFTWEIANEDELRMVSSGEMGNQFVPKNYTVTEISSTTMKWEDLYGLTSTLNKVSKGK